MLTSEQKRKIQNLCDIGYQTADILIYGQIDEILAGAEQSEQVRSLRRLAQGGPTLASKRFAFPHIADSIRG